MASPRPIDSSLYKNRRMSNQTLAESPFRQSARLGTSPGFNTGPASLRSLPIGAGPATASRGNSRRTSFDNLDRAAVTASLEGSSSNPFLSGSPSSAHQYVPGSAARSNSPSVYSLNVNNPDPEVVRVVGRHLVTDDDVSSSFKPDIPGPSSGPISNGDPDGSRTPNGNGESFDSLRLQGGDITRQLYKWQQEHEPDSLKGRTRQKRSKSFEMPRPVNPDAQNIKVPGGFRRNFISQRAQETHQASPNFLTRNFIEFLSLYGHFAGEELEEDDEYDYSEEGQSDEDQAASGGRRRRRRDDEEADEETALLPRHKSGKKEAPANATATKAVMLLLKSFVGTGVLFLPKAFFNGGLLFSTLSLIFVASLSQLCFLLLIESRKAVGVSSFGDIGGALYGPAMRRMILFSIVLSQIGFASAYIVFTSENLQALILSVTNNKTLINIETLIFVQLIVFLPLSMIRNIAKLSGTALVADFFILLGLLYLYYWGGLTIARNGVSDVKMFNPKDWTLFIGTAIFTFEGIGLIIPVQESMKKPSQFPYVLGGVMIGITAIFVSMGALSYSAYGSDVKTVVILNLPQDSNFVSVIQLLYSLAILLSTPLQLFPAIRILENGIFVRSGKYNNKIKWQKNIFRFFLVFLTALVAWGGADDLDRFVALIGSFACIPLGNIYPPMLHLKACAKTTFAKALDILVICIGVVAMTYTTYTTVSSWIQNP